MDDVFQCAVDSLLSLFGGMAEIGNGNERTPVRASPLFSSKLKNEKTGAKILASSANVIVASADGVPFPGIFPEKTFFLFNGEEYRILCAHKIESAGKTIAHELEIKR